MINKWILLFSIVCSSGPSFAAALISERPLVDGYKICFVGDTGTASSQQYKVAKALEAEGCDQVRVLGDVIYSSGLRSSKDRKFQSHFYKPYKNLLESQNVPFYLVMGNHDHRSDPTVWYDIVPNYQNIVFPNLYYFERYGDVCFVSLDTNTEYSRQVKWFAEIYRTAGSACKLSFAMAHHPLISVGAHGNAGSTVRRFLAKTVTGKVDAYFAGHDHNLSYEGTKLGTHFFVSGAGAKLRSLSDDPKPGNFAISKNGFVTVTIDRSGPRVKANYSFRTVRSASKVETPFSGSFVGQGIR